MERPRCDARLERDYIAAGVRVSGLAAQPGASSKNVPEFVLGYLAIARLGAVMCTLHMPYRGAEVQALMRHSGARLAICMPQAKGMFEGRGVAFSEIDSAQDVDLVLRRIANNKLPEELVVLAEMPLTPTREIIKGRLTLP